MVRCFKANDPATTDRQTTRITRMRFARARSMMRCISVPPEESLSAKSTSDKSCPESRLARQALIRGSPQPTHPLYGPARLHVFGTLEPSSEQRRQSCHPAVARRFQELPERPLGPALEGEQLQTSPT